VSSHAWARAAADADQAAREATKAWQGSEFLARKGIAPESAEPANRIAWGHRSDPLAPRFETLAEAVYGPLLAAAQKERAG
jgi:hypothetical protein